MPTRPRAATWSPRAHLPFPGIGRLRAEGKGYVWVPLTYNSVR